MNLSLLAAIAALCVGSADCIDGTYECIHKKQEIQNKVMIEAIKKRHMSVKADDADSEYNVLECWKRFKGIK